MVERTRKRHGKVDIALARDVMHFAMHPDTEHVHSLCPQCHAHTVAATEWCIHDNAEGATTIDGSRRPTVLLFDPVLAFHVVGRASTKARQRSQRLLRCY